MSAAPVEFTITSTLADALAAEAPKRPGRPRRRRLTTRAAVFASVFIATAVGTGLFDNPNDPMLFFKSMMAAKPGLMALASFLAITAIVAAMMRVARAINTALRRWLVADFRRHHPAVDPGDPTLGVTRSFRFDETGVTTATPYDEIWESWRRVTALDETPDLLILRVGGLLNLPIPKRQLAADLRERLQHYVDARSQSRWPF